jgi:IS5 family transposase
MVVDTDGIPIEFSFTPGNCSDIKALKNMDLNLPKGSLILGDRAYTSYEFEDQLLELQGIKLIPKRRKDLKRQHSCEINKKLRSERNRVEAVFSSIVSRMPRNIRARTESGFCLKVIFFILAYMANLFHPL